MRNTMKLFNNFSQGFPRVGFCCGTILCKAVLSLPVIFFLQYFLFYSEQIQINKNPRREKKKRERKRNTRHKAIRTLKRCIKTTTYYTHIIPSH